MTSEVSTSGVTLQRTSRHPDTEVHVPHDILFPDWQKWQGVVHLNESPPAIRPVEVQTGCYQTVNEKRATFSPKKATCTECRKFAQERHHDIWVMLHFVYDSMMGDDVLRGEIEGLLDYHEGHYRAFGENNGN